MPSSSSTSLLYEKMWTPPSCDSASMPPNGYTPYASMVGAWIDEGALDN